MSLVQLLHPSWLAWHLLPLLRGLLYAIHDLSEQMSQGALGMVTDCVRLLLDTVFPSCDGAGEQVQDGGRTAVPRQSSPIVRRNQPSTDLSRHVASMTQRRRGRSASQSGKRDSPSMEVGQPQDDTVDDGQRDLMDTTSEMVS